MLKKYYVVKCGAMAENCTDFERKRNVLQLALDCLEKSRKIRAEEPRRGNMKLQLENVTALQGEIREILHEMAERAELNF